MKHLQKNNQSFHNNLFYFIPTLNKIPFNLFIITFIEFFHLTEMPQRRPPQFFWVESFDFIKQEVSLCKFIFHYFHISMIDSNILPLRKPRHFLFLQNRITASIFFFFNILLISKDKFILLQKQLQNTKIIEK